eukprot:TRINITY_DN106724_c0_g1_i4.p4 TRINITY_DN106724_c0_g1~~TRINITY_DN106724_c0_g1_i4.p4  ORF type:complete len:180 (-),score=22.65 TRINITY_DN106724_c0_g1_i4:198-737(-)
MIADKTAGVIGISYKPVPCYKGDILPSKTAQVSPFLYKNGFIGYGWILEKYDFNSFNLRASGRSREQVFCMALNYYGGFNFQNREGAQPSFVEGKLTISMKGHLNMMVTIETQGTENRLELTEFTQKQINGEWKQLSVKLSQFGISSGTKIDRVTIQNKETPNPYFCMKWLKLSESLKM